MNTRYKTYRRELLSTFLVTLVVFIAIPLSAQQKELKWTPFEEAIEIAEKEQKLVMVDVWAPWCGWCKKMREEVYPELINKINDGFILTRINRDDNSTKIRYQNFNYTPLRLAQKLKVDTVPGIIFINSQGEYIAHITGFQEKEKLDEVLEIVLE